LIRIAMNNLLTRALPDITQPQLCSAIANRYRNSGVISVQNTLSPSSRALSIRSIRERDAAG